MNQGESDDAELEMDARTRARDGRGRCPWSTVRAEGPAVGQCRPEVTYTKDIAPILQRSCENCHRPGGGGPMPMTTYEEVRPWARAIKQRTGIGPHAGVMPPWYMEKNIGIQKYKDDPSLSAAEVAKVAKWADSGAPRGNPADMPPAKQYAGRQRLAHRHARPDRQDEEHHRQGELARLVGRDRARADSARRGSLRPRR